MGTDAPNFRTITMEDIVANAVTPEMIRANTVGSRPSRPHGIRHTFALLLIGLADWVSPGSFYSTRRKR